ncbi:MAG TPA: hypothetical protein VJS38_07900 [Phenylobacterium sp.]|uniref:hypothetical protein n=1 Tax=Phenylobacterium sp. TaxID=1871053 RepID=UPI002B466578|nr:hypothetical protein [Phenylobacterium sp.]HKR88085.1 hypothetical protein [Phenylobacterium sp.]
MKRIMLAAAAALVLAGCETYDGYGYGGGGVAYYDDFYGPFYDGYWGRDNLYYYRHGHHGPWVRDEAGHFRHDHPQGFHGVHGHGGFMGFHHGPPQGGRHGGGHGGPGPHPQ